MIYKYQRNLSVLGRSQSTIDNYSRHLASISLYFNELPTELDPEQIQEYMYIKQKESKTPSQTYFKFSVYSLRFLLKSEGLSYEYLKLPVIKHEKKLPVVLSKEEVWAMLKNTRLLKHKILIGLLYGCGLRCFEVRNIRIADMDFDRKRLHVVQGKGKKDRYVPLSEHLIRGLKTYLEAEKPEQWIFNGQPIERSGGDFDSRYSQRGVQWAVKQSAKAAGIIKEVHVHTLRHTFATHLLEDGMDIMTVKELLGHERIETTMEYLHVMRNRKRDIFSPLDTLFAQCSRNMK
jgi:integrase/recombinase XerD